MPTTQTNLIAALDAAVKRARADRAATPACCTSRTHDHDALCPNNPDPSICDNCYYAYDPALVNAHPDCPGGHCADDACACRACTYLPRPVFASCD